MKYLSITEPLELENGDLLPEYRIAYKTWGVNKGDNVVWVFHALTANADAEEWWSGIVGTGRLLDPDRYFVICANVLGSCYGTTGPGSINPKTGKAWGQQFPLVTIRDIVSVHRVLADHLGVDQIYLGIGGSLGGQQLLEWAAAEPERFQHLVPIATNARHSPWGIAFNESQRMAMANGLRDGASEEDLAAGLEAARAVAMLSYRSYHTYADTQADTDETIDAFRASSYQRYQGEKLRKRFDPYSYWYLSKAMDSHHVGRNRGGIAAALSAIRSKCLLIGISTDLLFPVKEQEEVAARIPGAGIRIIDSSYGHDGFLVEEETLSGIVQQLLEGEIRPGEGKAPLRSPIPPRKGLPGSERF